MQARREAEMGIWRAIDQEGIGLIKNFGIAISRTDQGSDRIPRLNRLAGDD